LEAFFIYVKEGSVLQCGEKEIMVGIWSIENILNRVNQDLFFYLLDNENIHIQNPINVWTHIKTKLRHHLYLL